jgi:hypothetical protein
MLSIYIKIYNKNLSFATIDKCSQNILSISNPNPPMMSKNCKFNNSNSSNSIISNSIISNSSSKSKSSHHSKIINHCNKDSLNKSLNSGNNSKKLRN